MRRRGQLPRPPRWQIAARSVRWTAGAVALGLGLAWDLGLGRPQPRSLGLRLRALFERVGGTAIKLGQQLSVRSDLLPAEICDALSALTDRVPPIPPEQVRPLIEAGLGRPLHALLAELDPEPIGSASVACVYAGRLHDGTRVAVKLRRPEIAERFATDLAILGRLLRLCEQLTLVRDGTFAHLRADLATMLGEETDLALEARTQRAFRRLVRRADLPWVDAPEPVDALCSERVLVSRFVDGLPAHRALQAAAGDPDARRDLARTGIDLRRTARRLALFSTWARLEAPFFHADPHPGNVLLLPGDRIAMIDFGAAGALSARTRRNHLEVLRRMVDLDVTGVARVAVADLSPVPFFDTHEVLSETERSFGSVILAALDPDAPWSSRVISAVWMRLVEVSRRFQIRMNLDTVRSIRAFLLYDALAIRLDPTIGFGLVRRYLRHAARRTARRTLAADRPPGAALPEATRRTAAILDALAPLLASARVTHTRTARAATLAARAALRLAAAGCVALAALSAHRIAENIVPAELATLAAATALGTGALSAALSARRALSALSLVGAPR